MKKLLLMLLFAFSFSKTGVYVSYDVSASWEASWNQNAWYYAGSDSGDFDSGALTVGYERELANSITAGASYDVVALEEEDGTEIQIFNIYGKYHYPLENDMKAWGSLGYNMPMSDDMDDLGLESGLSYGFGLTMANGIGVSYFIHNFSVPAEGTFPKFDYSGSRFSVYYSF